MALASQDKPANRTETGLDGRKTETACWNKGCVPLTAKRSRR